MPNSFLPSFASFRKASSEGKVDCFAPIRDGWLLSENSLIGVILLGDALNMRHPLTGGGMTVAFNDSLILSELLGGISSSVFCFIRNSCGSTFTGDSRLPVDLEDWAQVQVMLEQWWSRRRAVAGTVNTLAQALYSLFGADGTRVVVVDSILRCTTKKAFACRREP
jgi:squalene monooxygenase